MFEKWNIGGFSNLTRSYTALECRQILYTFGFCRELRPPGSGGLAIGQKCTKPAPMAEGHPAKIGRYQIERELGQGAMGQVYLARDLDLDREVALKTIKARDLSPEKREAFLERFKNEARAAAKLHHPNIVQVYDVGEDPEYGPYLVFEYVAGQNLKEVLRSRGPLDPSELTKLARQMADGLTAAHAAGIIHRDLKPENLLFTPEGDVKLADFGIARLPDANLTREGQFLGTPCYSAPETLTEARYGEASDLFSMAAVLYEAATGKRAFPGSDALGVAHRVVSETPPPPSEVSEGPLIPHGVDRVIMAGLNKRPEDRPPSPHSLSRAIRDAYIGADILLPETRIADESPLIGAASQERKPPAKNFQFGSLFPWILMLLGTIAFAGYGLGVFDKPPAEESPAPQERGVEARHEAGKTPTKPQEKSGINPPEKAAEDASANAQADDEPSEEVREDAESDTGGALPHDAGADADAAPKDSPDAGAGASEKMPTTMADSRAAKSLSALEREELAKEAIFDARRAIERGRFDIARRELDRAEELDPGLRSISELRAELERKDGGS